MAKDKLTPKQARFVQEYLIDLNATAAAKRAGYSPKTSEAIGLENLGKPRIAEQIAEAQAKLAERTAISQEWVIEQLIDNLEKAKTDVAKLDNKGEPTGEYIYQGGVANKALELIGKHLGMFGDKLEVNVPQAVTHEVLLINKPPNAKPD